MPHTPPLPGHPIDGSCASQWARLLAQLRLGPVDTISARRDLNIMMPAARVRELRRRGFGIETVPSTVTDELGRPHPGVALYVLHAGTNGQSAFMQLPLPLPT